MLVGEVLLNALEKEIYICSFSGSTKDPNIDKHGQLSQWRGYGSDNGRFCIVLDTKELENLCDKEFQKFSYMGLGLGDIVYSDQVEEFYEEFKGNLDAIVDYIPALTQAVISKRVKKRARAAPYNEFIATICRYKHFGFKEENEVRVYAHLPPSYMSKSDKTCKTPVDVNGKKVIKLFSDLSEKLPIVRIIVGPHQKIDESTERLRKMVENSDIEIDVSAIPFLD